MLGDCARPSCELPIKTTTRAQMGLEYLQKSQRNAQAS
jgi:hypothetical protein